ncbi:MAG: ATP-dependent zinc metalloprotease FtsH, partial [Solirubrobacteraceae bacterium]
MSASEPGDGRTPELRRPDPPPAAKTSKADEAHGHGHRPWRVEGARKPDPGAASPPRPAHRMPRFWILMMIALSLNWIVALAIRPGDTRVTVPYSVFRSQAQVGNVAQVSSKGATIQGTFTKKVKYPTGKNGKTATEFKTVRPAFADDQILGLLLSKKAVVNAKAVDTGQSIWVTLLIGFVPTVLLVGFFVFMMRRAAGGGGAGGMLGGMGRSKARKYTPDEQQRTTFADVAGIDEATEELTEVVDFVKHPDRYRRLGGMIPKGVLLSGLPGTGKTLLARAVAGEAEVPFYSVSASEFVEMIVGVGASRVRDLFEQAKKDAPSIIFIDELDAIGRARGGNALGGGSDEREQTLNQILTEMDGFTGAEGVIVLCATNRPEVLDPALLRAGRFDRRITINPPDREGRLQILRVHTRSVPLADPADLEALASTTPGMVGADLRNLVNEAALSAARRDHEQVTAEDLSGALERILLGAARRIVLSEDDRRRTAYHEPGHALLGMLAPGADPVRKVSIIPRGRSLGVTFQSPESDRYAYGERYLRGRLVGLLGGHAAEQLVDGEATTGAESDLEQATALARQMVGRWGMSPRVGLVTALPGPGQDGFVMPGSAAAASARTLELIDDEVRRIIDESHAEALKA